MDSCGRLIALLFLKIFFLMLKLYHNIKSKKLIYMKLLFRSKPKILSVGSGFQCALWEIVKRPGETYCVILRLKVWNF